MDMIGTVVRLQVQTSSLKVEASPRRQRYDPTPIVSIPMVALDEGGMIAPRGPEQSVVDVHHRIHPDSKYRDGNAVSILFTPHYAAMRDHFGSHLEDGIAGESILVETGSMVALGDLERGVTLLTAEGEWIDLTRAQVAEPCVEFTRFALRFPADAPSDRSVTNALTFLRGGMRGFYLDYRGDPVTLRLGDPVYLP